jgi:hypothetical protein
LRRILRLLAGFQLLLMSCTWPIWLNSQHFPLCRFGPCHQSPSKRLW